MVVNSLAFLWFFLAVMVVYYLCQPKKQVQNIFLLACSYWFYAQVDIKMTGLLAILTLSFWLMGRGIGQAIEQEKERLASRLTTLSVVAGIGALFYFKYLNFFIGSFVTAANAHRPPPIVDSITHHRTHRPQLLHVQADELHARHLPRKDRPRAQHLRLCQLHRLLSQPSFPDLSTAPNHS